MQHLKKFICWTDWHIERSRNKEHIRYIKTINPVSAYTCYILNNRHAYGNAEQTTEILKLFYKGIKMNYWESFFRHVL